MKKKKKRESEKKSRDCTRAPGNGGRGASKGGPAREAGGPTRRPVRGPAISLSAPGLRTYGHTDGGTKPHIEMRGRI